MGETVEQPLLVAICSCSAVCVMLLSQPHRFLCQDAAAGVVLLKVRYCWYKNNHFCFLQTGTCAGNTSNSNFDSYMQHFFKFIFNVKNIYLILVIRCRFVFLNLLKIIILKLRDMCTFLFFSDRI